MLSILLFSEMNKCFPPVVSSGYVLLLLRLEPGIRLDNLAGFQSPLPV